MIKVRVGGVPEHFNYPWKKALKEGALSKVGIDVVWEDYLGGTGAMCKSLRNDEIDMAISLTEGILKDISEGNPSEIVSFYIQSPLIWGIHTAKDNNIGTATALKEPILVSRMGSGSHLMAKVHAHQNDINSEELQFEIVQNLDGARDYFKEHNKGIFLWEKYTTKPYVDNGEMKRISEVTTPWPCFVIAASNSFLASNREVIFKVFEVLKPYVDYCQNNPESDHEIADYYHLKKEDVTMWKSTTKWAELKNIDSNSLDSYKEILKEIGILT